MAVTDAEAARYGRRRVVHPDGSVTFEKIPEGPGSVAAPPEVKPGILQTPNEEYQKRVYGEQKTVARAVGKVLTKGVAATPAAQMVGAAAPAVGKALSKVPGTLGADALRKIYPEMPASAAEALAEAGMRGAGKAGLKLAMGLPSAIGKAVGVIHSVPLEAAREIPRSVERGRLRQELEAMHREPTEAEKPLVEPYVEQFPPSSKTVQAIAKDLHALHPELKGNEFIAALREKTDRITQTREIPAALKGVYQAAKGERFTSMFNVLGDYGVKVNPLDAKTGLGMLGEIGKGAGILGLDLYADPLYIGNPGFGRLTPEGRAAKNISDEALAAEHDAMAAREAGRIKQDILNAQGPSMPPRPGVRLRPAPRRPPVTDAELVEDVNRHALNAAEFGIAGGEAPQKLEGALVKGGATEESVPGIAADLSKGFRKVAAARRTARYEGQKNELALRGLASEADNLIKTGWTAESLDQFNQNPNNLLAAAKYQALRNPSAAPEIEKAVLERFPTMDTATLAVPLHDQRTRASILSDYTNRVAAHYAAEATAAGVELKDLPAWVRVRSGLLKPGGLVNAVPPEQIVFEGIKPPAAPALPAAGPASPGAEPTARILVPHEPAGDQAFLVEKTYLRGGRRMADGVVLSGPEKGARFTIPAVVQSETGGVQEIRGGARLVLGGDRLGRLPTSPEELPALLGIPPEGVKILPGGMHDVEVGELKDIAGLKVRTGTILSGPKAGTEIVLPKLAPEDAIPGAKIRLSLSRTKSGKLKTFRVSRETSAATALDDAVKGVRAPTNDELLAMARTESARDHPLYIWKRPDGIEVPIEPNEHYAYELGRNQIEAIAMDDVPAAGIKAGDTVSFPHREFGEPTTIGQYMEKKLAPAVPPKAEAFKAATAAVEEGAKLRDAVAEFLEGPETFKALKANQSRFQRAVENEEPLAEAVNRSSATIETLGGGNSVRAAVDFAKASPENEALALEYFIASGDRTGLRAIFKANPAAIETARAIKAERTLTQTRSVADRFDEALQDYSVALADRPSAAVAHPRPVSASAPDVLKPYEALARDHPNIRPEVEDDIPPGQRTLLFDPVTGQPSPAHYEVVPDDYIIASHELGGLRPTLGYPEKLFQARDLGVPAEREKIRRILTEFDPRHLTSIGETAEFGPPTVMRNKDGRLFVLAGNSRMAALRLLGPVERGAYEAEAGMRALELGLPFEPGNVLVRVLDEPSTAEAARFAANSNFQRAGELSETAKARAMLTSLGLDVRTLPPFGIPAGGLRKDNVVDFLTNEAPALLRRLKEAGVPQSQDALYDAVSSVFLGMMPPEVGTVVEMGNLSAAGKEFAAAYRETAPHAVSLQSKILEGKIDPKFALLSPEEGKGPIAESARLIASLGKAMGPKEQRALLTTLQDRKTNMLLELGGETKTFLPIFSDVTPEGAAMAFLVMSAAGKADPAETMRFAMQAYAKSAVQESQGANLFGEAMRAEPWEVLGNAAGINPSTFRKLAGMPLAGPGATEFIHPLTVPFWKNLPKDWHTQMIEKRVLPPEFNEPIPFPGNWTDEQKWDYVHRVADRFSKDLGEAVADDWYVGQIRKGGLARTHGERARKGQESLFSLRIGPQANPWWEWHISDIPKAPLEVGIGVDYLELARRASELGVGVPTALRRMIAVGIHVIMSRRDTPAAWRPLIREAWRTTFEGMPQDVSQNALDIITHLYRTEKRVPQARGTLQVARDIAEAMKGSTPAEQKLILDAIEAEGVNARRSLFEMGEEIRAGEGQPKATEPIPDYLRKKYDVVRSFFARAGALEAERGALNKAHLGYVTHLQGPAKEAALSSQRALAYTMVPSVFGSGKSSYDFARSSAETIDEINKFYQKELGYKVLDERLAQLLFIRSASAEELAATIDYENKLLKMFARPWLKGSKEEMLAQIRPGEQLVLPPGSFEKLARFQSLTPAKQKIVMSQYTVLFNDAYKSGHHVAAFPPAVAPYLRDLVQSGELEGFLVPAELLDIMQRHKRVWSRPSEFAQVLHAGLATWRDWTIFPFPEYHLKNIVGNYANLWEYGFSPQELGAASKQAWNVMDQETAKRRGIETVTAGDRTYALGELYELAAKNDISRTGTMAELAGRESAREMLEGPRRADFLRRLPPITVGKDLARIAEDHGRMTGFIAALNRGMPPRQAAEVVFATLFNAEDLPKGEQFIREALIPFWTWARNNVIFQAKMAMREPARFSLPYRMRESIQSSTGAPESYDPYYRSGNWTRIAVAPEKTNADGTVTPARVLYFNGFNWLPSFDVSRLAPEPIGYAQGDIAERMFSQLQGTLISAGNPYFRIGGALANRNLATGQRLTEAPSSLFVLEHNPRMAYALGAIRALNYVDDMIARPIGQVQGSARADREAESGRKTLYGGPISPTRALRGVGMRFVEEYPRVSNQKAYQILTARAQKLQRDLNTAMKYSPKDTAKLARLSEELDDVQRKLAGMASGEFVP